VFWHEFMSLPPLRAPGWAGSLKTEELSMTLP